MRTLMNESFARQGFIAAGIMNICGVLLFSKGLSNEAINNADPIVMSNFGLLMIMIWGLTYIAAAISHADTKWLAGIFSLEKLVYFLVWSYWITTNSLKSVYETDLMAGIFYSIYGINDLAFMIFFIWAFIRNPKL